MSIVFGVAILFAGEEILTEGGDLRRCLLDEIGVPGRHNVLSYSVSLVANKFVEFRIDGCSGGMKLRLSRDGLA